MTTTKNINVFHLIVVSNGKVCSYLIHFILGGQTLVDGVELPSQSLKLKIYISSNEIGGLFINSNSFASIRNFSFDLTLSLDVLHHIIRIDISFFELLDYFIPNICERLESPHDDGDDFVVELWTQFLVIDLFFFGQPLKDRDQFVL